MRRGSLRGMYCWRGGRSRRNRGSMTRRRRIFRGQLRRIRSLRILGVVTPVSTRLRRRRLSSRRRLPSTSVRRRIQILRRHSPPLSTRSLHFPTMRMVTLQNQEPYFLARATALKGKDPSDTYNQSIHFSEQALARDPKNFIAWDMLGNALNYRSHKESFSEKIPSLVGIGQYYQLVKQSPSLQTFRGLITILVLVIGTLVIIIARMARST